MGGSYLKYLIDNHLVILFIQWFSLLSIGLRVIILLIYIRWAHAYTLSRDLVKLAILGLEDSPASKYHVKTETPMLISAVEILNKEEKALRRYRETEITKQA